jgi:hypothetical protein
MFTVTKHDDGTVSLKIDGNELRNAAAVMTLRMKELASTNTPELRKPFQDSFELWADVYALLAKATLGEKG